MIAVTEMGTACVSEGLEWIDVWIRLLRKDREQGKDGVVSALRSSSDLWSFSAIQTGDKPIEGVGVRSRDQSNKGNIVVRVYYGLPDHRAQVKKSSLLGSDDKILSLIS